MRRTGTQGRKLASNATRRIAVLAAAFLFLTAAPFSCRRQQPDTSPPDLTACTHLEIEWPRGVLGCFLGGTAIQQNILNNEERRFIRSLDPYGVKDPNAIRALAHVLREGTYTGRTRGMLAWGAPVRVTCYDGGDRLTAFTVYGETIVVEDGGKFECQTYVSELDALVPPEIRPFVLRFHCAMHLGALRVAGPLRRRGPTAYPAPGTWSDAVVQALRAERIVDTDGAVKPANSDASIAMKFTCPSVRGSIAYDETREPTVSHYAMNPNCEPNSPPDTVLLFETKPGWNQHGGAELFTFDNHDPKGGCVLLNDGTVKFVRTREELDQLRWKP